MIIGETQVPIASIMDYLSIVDYITNTAPDFKDDFSKTDSLWLPIAKDVSTVDMVKYGALDLLLNAGVQKDGYKLSSESVRAEHFAIEFDFYFDEGTGGTTLGVGFPSTGRNGDTDINISIDPENQKWLINLADGTREYQGKISKSLKGKWSHVQVIFFNTQVGLFLDDNFLGNAEGINHNQDELWIFSKTGGQGHVMLDNIKFWNLSGLDISGSSPNPDISSTVPTSDPAIQSAFDLIQSNKPTYERTFEFSWDREFFAQLDETKIEDGKLIVTSYNQSGRGHITASSETFGPDMFAVEFEYRRLDSNVDSQCSFWYGGKNGYITAEFFSNGQVNLSVTDLGEIASYNYDVSKSNMVTIIRFGDRITGFINRQLMYTALNIEKNIIFGEQFFQSTNGAVCEFDNYKYWDLSK